MPEPHTPPRPEALLEGRCALVTGSTGGIGLSMAQGLARAGCRVVLHGMEIDPPQESLRTLVGLERAVELGYVHADLSDPSAIQRMVEEVTALHGGIDVLVNNAVTRNFHPIESFPVADWDKALAVNLSAAFHAIRLALPGMRERGWGRIFNMTSVYGTRAAPNRIDYVTTKSALLGMTRAVALETLNQGITCNAICPGSVLTPNIESRLQALMQKDDLDRDAATHLFLAGKQPSGRFVDPAHVADLLVFLCGPAGQDITGAMLPIEGGWLAS
jgi:3-hydroxybutyrate dehydrogenase